MVMRKLKTSFKNLRKESRRRSDLLILVKDVETYIKLGNYKRAQIRAQKLVNDLNEE
jgi:predicted thioesterase